MMMLSPFVILVAALSASASASLYKRQSTGSLINDIAALKLDASNLDLDITAVNLTAAQTNALNTVLLQYALTLENLELTFCAFQSQCRPASSPVNIYLSMI